MRLPLVTSVILAPVLLAACVGSQTGGVRNGPQSVSPTGTAFVPVAGTVVAVQKSQIAPKASPLSQKAVAPQVSTGIAPHVAESMQIFRTTCM
ncbi:MAG: hypothetical protein VX181_17395, partial [Pseudomonadota bacterium]|nr:hypothetical protein [Pseudomonadota bacterium]